MTRYATDCITINESGLFKGDIHAGNGRSFHSRTTIRALFNTYSCKQLASVLNIVGTKGQCLGNDNYDNAQDVEKGWTDGMNNSPPALSSVRGHFGLETMGDVE